jgi:hypothetical protein
MHLAKVMRQHVVVEMIYLPMVLRRENHLTAADAILRRNHDAAQARAGRK